jgi:uncharacterized protein (TIGR02284 family)
MSISDTFKSTPKSTLKHLIQVCKDGQEGFAKAAEAVKNANMKAVFSKYSLQRAKFAGELEAELLQLGEEDPQKEGSSVAGALHRGWIDLKSALSSGKPHAILEEAERGEDVAKKAYKEALEQDDLPANVREIIARQAAGVQEGHDETKALRDVTA